MMKIVGGVGCGGVVSEGGGAHLDMGQMGQTISFFSCFCHWFLVVFYFSVIRFCHKNRKRENKRNRCFIILGDFALFQG